MSAFATLNDVLAECGGTSENLKLLFPRIAVGKWVTVRADTDVQSPSFDEEAEMAAVAQLPETALTKMALVSSIAELRNSYFICEKLEFFAFDADRSILPNWQPNHFNPQVIVNDERLLSSLEKPSKFGLVLPYCISFDSPFLPLKSIDVQAKLLKPDTNNVLRHVTTLCLATFRYR